MPVATIQDRPSLEALVDAIACSPIVVGMTVTSPRNRLPAGFDDVDIAVLEWIAAEGRRAGRSYIQM